MRELSKETDSLYDQYVKAIHEAYESEAHFCAMRPRSPELAAKATAAWEAFAVSRSKDLEEEKK